MHILAVLESPSWAEHHISGSLRDMGHEVRVFTHGEGVGDFYGRARAALRAERNRNLVALARELRRVGRLDFIFCYVYDDFLEQESAKALAALGVPLVNLNVDMANQWYRQIKTAKFFTHILCAQRMNMHHLARYGARVLYFPMAARLPIGGQRDVLADDHDFAPPAPVTFLGTPMPYRSRVLSFLEEANIPLAVYGKYWEENRDAAPEHSSEKTLSDIYNYAFARLRAEGLTPLFEILLRRFGADRTGAAPVPLSPGARHGFLPGGAVNTLFRKSAINLGFTRMVGDDPNVPGVTQVKLRDFEVPAAGGFYLVEAAPDYDALFKPGEEVETWRTPGELLDKVRYYLQDEPAREKIAAAGRKRALAEHGWTHRFGALFVRLGLS